MRCMLDLRSPAGVNENGAALVIGLMFLAILAMAGATAVVLTTTDLQIGSNYKASQQAFNVAQAGINEALYRLSLFSDNTQPPPSGSMININGIIDAAIQPDVDNSDWKAKILFASSAPEGWNETDNTLYTNTIQPSGSWADLEYSVSTDDGTALTIRFLKDSSDNVLHYDASKTPPYNAATGGTAATGQPVVVITSTGRANGAASEIRVRAVRQPVNIKAESAVMVDMGPDLTGSALISGLNHTLSTTPSDEKDGPKWHETEAFKSDGIDNHGGKEGAATDVDTDLNPSEEDNYESEIAYGQKLETSGHKPGVWTTQPADTVSPGNIDVFGGNDTAAWKEEGAPDWPSLAELIGVSQETLDSILTNANVTVADMDGSKLAVAPQGVIFIDNYGGDTLKITASTPESEDGWGLMYVTGNARFEKLYFKGLIYVEGDAVIVSNFWLLGCIAIQGDAEGDFSAGNGTFLYSEAALKLYVNKAMKFVPLTWEDSALSNSSGSWLGS
jgi:Tfp pilus assembly protein PilX